MTVRRSDEDADPKEARRRFELPTTKTFKKNLTARLEQKPGSEVYAFSHPEGSKDYRFWAVTLAVYAAEKEPKHEPIIAISF